jgi:hypothetical protein
MTGKVTIHRSPVFIVRQRWWWPFGVKCVSPEVITCCVHGIDGAVGEFTITLPSSKAHRIAVGEYELDCADAEGAVVWTKRDHHKHEV